MTWGTMIERVRRDRIIVAVAAWAYEDNRRPIMSDSAYDKLSCHVRDTINVATGSHRLDRFFQRHFDSSTGLWIHAHPDIPGLENIYARYYQRQRRRRKRR